MQAAVSHLSPYAGSWYPDGPAELRDLVDGLFLKSGSRTGAYLSPDAVGFVVPHAGLVYSGTVAAAAYRHLEAAGTKRAVIIGFSHRGAEPGAAIPDAVAFRTPLGGIEVDRDAVAALLEGGEFRLAPAADLCDHSVEIQLPLLQRAVPEAKVIPVYAGHLDAKARAAVARRLAELVGPGTVLIASSDLTHYGKSFGFRPFPADEDVAGRLEELDGSVMEAAGSISPEFFLAALRSSGATVCGYEPVALLLETLASFPGGEIFQEKLDYQTSGELTGDFEHSVSYGALGYFPEPAFRLGDEDQALLLGSARQTLRRYLDTGERKPVPPERITPALERLAGAFVTLHCHGELRGCVGRRSATEPLWETIPALTLAAALEDSRFLPVHRGEKGINLDISVLSPMKRLANTGDFRVNEHGALLESDGHLGLLLPQVATERNWTAQQFLDALARKTGVGCGVYEDPSTKLYAFRAQVIR